MGDEDFRIFQPHVDGRVGNVLPAPGRVLEDRHVDPPLREITKATRNRGRYQDELIVGLQLVQGYYQLRQQPGVGTAFRADGVRRKVRRTDSHQLCSRSRLYE
ncbi:hypothetical protein D3C71_1404740 [compost metagenome]